MAEPLVSVLVPLFDKEASVEATVRSALDQTHEAIEVLVIDDGSTDASFEVVRALADDRIRSTSRPNRGANATRNELLSWASGEYVQFLDADDWLHPRKLERQVAALDTGAAAAFCLVEERIGDQARVMTGWSGRSDLASFLIHSGIVTVGPLHRRSVLEAAGGFDETLRASQEYDLHLRMLRSGLWEEVVQVDDVLARWHRLENSVTSDEVRVYSEKVRVLEQHGAVSADDHFRQECGRALMNAARHLARGGDRSGAVHAIRAALRLSPDAVEGLPARQRRLARSPELLVRWEQFEDVVRRRRGRSGR